jgi:hypothetical protein
MMNLFKGFALILLFCVFAIAQEVSTEAEPVAPAEEAVVEAETLEPVAAVEEIEPVVEAPAEESVVEAPEEPVEEAPPAEVIEETPEAAIVAPPVETVVEAPVAPVATVEEVAPVVPAIPKEPLDIKFGLGIRVGLGLSDFRDHKALPFGIKAAQPKPDFSYSIGIVPAFGITDLISVAPEVQLTYYSASNEYAIKTGTAFMDMNEVFVYMYSLELPIMTRFDLGVAYAELGPQIGYNHYAKIYMNNEPKKPDVNVFAFGPSIGGGIKIDGMLLGVRGYFGITEYANKSNGYPWHVQVSLTNFFF